MNSNVQGSTSDKQKRSRAVIAFFSPLVTFFRALELIAYNVFLRNSVKVEPGYNDGDGDHREILYDLYVAIRDFVLRISMTGDEEVRCTTPPSFKLLEK